MHLQENQEANKKKYSDAGKDASLIKKEMDHDDQRNQQVIVSHSVV